MEKCGKKDIPLIGNIVLPSYQPILLTTVFILSNKFWLNELSFVQSDRWQCITQAPITSFDQRFTDQHQSKIKRFGQENLKKSRTGLEPGLTQTRNKFWRSVVPWFQQWTLWPQLSSDTRPLFLSRGPPEKWHQAPPIFKKLNMIEFNIHWILKCLKTKCGSWIQPKRKFRWNNYTIFVVLLHQRLF